MVFSVIDLLEGVTIWISIGHTILFTYLSLGIHSLNELFDDLG
jgi:hypothetical protein